MMSNKQDLLIETIVGQLCENSRFTQTAQYKQHGKTSVYEHSIAVAYTSCWIAGRLHVHVDYISLIRGALLHDYYLYDWHDKSDGHRLHGFFHPRRALENACEDFELTAKEKNMILRHMFPLTPIPPYYLESWIVCAADKLCAMKETFRMTELQHKKTGAYLYEFK
ncbi:HD domain-containing protein [Youngiibacter fragilis]|uniref:Phosphohydrolase n=1 Tax=Youngiibacter fragilis 232.1 TaxID=994573 RepID=V7IA23_9CLOT|nr:HD domain-containing protein [Youngiibacter fragilis]ETA81707.1 phosphohydrolase [Youngiibacter fragilis 232.1]